MLNRPSRRAPRTAPVLAPALVPVLAAAALLATAGCSGGAGAGAADDAAASASAVAARAPSPSPSVTVAPTLTEAQAKSALVAPADLGEGWAPTAGAATWRDALLKGKADAPDCQRLLDGLYAENLLGEPAGARAVTGLDDADDGTQLRYRIGAYDRAALDDSFRWLKTVPEVCGEFTATDVRGGQFTVRTAAAPLPALGETREGLRVTVSGEGGGDGSGDEDGDGGDWPAVLTLDFAAVRVGDSALSLTHGGLDGIDGDDTARAAEVGTRRLQEVLSGRTPAVRDSGDAEPSAASEDPEDPEDPESAMGSGKPAGTEESAEPEESQEVR
ncbi:hypothetical protein ACFYXC_17330 [Streptomyces sp. NPDC002701]|uniref:hypothetical protein n=1 Tax=Streptomyces sp. NPDC002701 TaxID=3364661 RepID=UPI0036B82377